MTNLEIGREKIPENGLELNRWSHLSQITLHNGIPFEIKLPNDLTDKVLKDSEQGKNLHKADSVDDLFLELDS